MRYCGIAVGPRFHHLCAIEELRTEEPPIRLPATFFEPGGAQQVLAQLRALGEVVVAVAGPLSEPGAGRDQRVCDQELRRLGVAPHPPSDGSRELSAAVRELGAFTPEQPAEGEGGGGHAGEIDTGVFHATPLFETSAEGIFCTLQGRRVPARRHPLGIQVRIEELADEHVVDEGGELWHRRIEELEAAAAALCAHRYAVGHASWVGDPDEGVVVLPGSQLPERFSTEGVMPPVPRAVCPRVERYAPSVWRRPVSRSRGSKPSSRRALSSLAQ